MTCIRSLLLLAVLPLVSQANAQEVASGPESDKAVPALKVFDATGLHKDKEVNYVAERKAKPTVYLFVQADKWDRPMARFLRTLDEAAAKEGEEVYVVAVWLTEDVDKTKAYLPVAQQSLQLQNTALTCFPGDKTGPKDWGINVDAYLTAVIVHRGLAVKSFGYRSVNETDVPAVRRALKKALAAK